MSIHKEIHLEAEICADLAAAGWLCDAADILAAFKPYCETAELSGVTDPDNVLTLKAKLDDHALYEPYEVDRVVNVALKGKRAKQSESEVGLVEYGPHIPTLCRPLEAGHFD